MDGWCSARRRRASRQSKKFDGYLKKNLVLNIDKITFIDSAGVGALVTSHNSVSSHGGALHLCRTAPKSKEMLRMTRMDPVFRFFDSESEVVQDYSK